MGKKARSLELRAAESSDLEFAWTAWSEAVKPHIGPIILSKFARNWADDDEKVRFNAWWSPKNSKIILMDSNSVGWLAYIEEGKTLNLSNFVVQSDFRRLGIASLILGTLLNQWSGDFSKVSHSVLKDSGHEMFFERFGFRTTGEDELVRIMEVDLAHIQ